MNYEQKYKFAIEQAKKELDACGSLDCDAARQIFRLFPELKKSDDERIRENAIQIIRYSMDGTDVALPLSIYKECIAWLEKQGKQSPVEELKQEQKEQTINKACEWLKENIYNHVYKCNEGLGFPTAAFLEEFKKAMEK